MGEIGGITHKQTLKHTCTHTHTRTHTYVHTHTHTIGKRVDFIIAAHLLGQIMDVENNGYYYRVKIVVNLGYKHGLLLLVI